nr:hypothetical protein [Tanacetum cinerariifolium]
MNEAVKVAVQLQSDRLRDEAQAENEDFINKLNENIQKIIKEQVKVQVSKILPKIEKTVNEQLEAEVLTRSSNSSKTSYVVAADLSELELKKILIEKIESNKSIHRSDEQRNLYKALVDAYECVVDDQPVAEASQNLEWFQKQKKPPTLDRAWNKTLPVTHGSIQPWISDLAKQADSYTSFNELMDTRKYTTSVTKIKAADYGYIKWIEDLVPRTMWSQAPVSYDKYALGGISHWGRKRQQFYGFTVNRESARDVYLKRTIITVIKLQIIEWHNYKHLDRITMRRDDNKLYKFKEGDLKRLSIQDTEDMLLLLGQGKLTNLNVKERFAFNVSLRVFTRSIVIQRRVEDL